MSDPMPAIRNILGMRDWQGDGWTPTTPPPDYADVIAERVIAEAGTSASLHEIAARAVRAGRELRDGATS